MISYKGKAKFILADLVCWYIFSSYLCILQTKDSWQSRLFLPATASSCIKYQILKAGLGNNNHIGPKFWFVGSKAQKKYALWIKVSKTCAWCAGVCFDCFGTQVFKSFSVENVKVQESDLLLLFLSIGDRKSLTWD